MRMRVKGNGRGMKCESRKWEQDGKRGSMAKERRKREGERRKEKIEGADEKKGRGNLRGGYMRKVKGRKRRDRAEY
jgi:hypothetical protein